MLKEIKTLKRIIKQLDVINTKIVKNPMLFYGRLGKRFILLCKEQHLIGNRLLKAGKGELIKEIPLEA